ncbi:MAG: 50S ribosomal protein L11 methyltransferase [Patescibacteria group bacterium]|jgi:SAM-dependent methyltransferase
MFTAYIITIISLIASVLALILALLFLIQLLIFKAPYVKTPKPVINRILEETEIKPTSVVYDLGCGNAELLIAIDKKIGAKTVGFELSPLAYQQAKYNVWQNKAKTKIYFKNFYKQDLSDADIVYCFLIKSVMPRIGALLLKQLKPGSQVICYGYSIPDWQPVKVIDLKPENPKSSKIFFYKV